MARALSRSRFQSRAPRRKTNWEIGPGSDGALVTYTRSTTLTLGAGAQAALAGQTIVRMRGLLTVALQSSVAVGTGYFGAVAIGIASADAAGVGVTALPNPIDDIGWPGWLYYQYVHAFSVGIDEEQWAPNSMQQIVIDSKAMRKIGINEVLFASGQFTEVGVSEMDVRLAIRTLVKLP